MISSLLLHRPLAMVKVSTRPRGRTLRTSTRTGSSTSCKEEGVKVSSHEESEVRLPYCPPLRATRTSRRTSRMDGSLLPRGRLRGELPGRLPVDPLHQGGGSNRVQRRGTTSCRRGSRRTQAAVAVNTGNHPRLSGKYAPALADRRDIIPRDGY